MLRIIFITKDGLACIEPKGMTDITSIIKRHVPTVVKRHEQGWLYREQYRTYELKGHTEDIYIYEEKD